jgi:hypothetical protein
VSEYVGLVSCVQCGATFRDDDEDGMLAHTCPDVKSNWKDDAALGLVQGSVLGAFFGIFGEIWD